MRIFDMVIWPFAVGMIAFFVISILSIVGLIVFAIIMIVRKSRRRKNNDENS